MLGDLNVGIYNDNFTHQVECIPNPFDGTKYRWKERIMKLYVSF